MRTLALVKRLFCDFLCALLCVVLILLCTFFIFVAAGKADTPSTYTVNTKLTVQPTAKIDAPSILPRKEPRHAWKRLTFDSGWWARAHWTATAFDSSSTGLMTSVCRTCYEADPVARWTLGRVPHSRKLAMDWAGESIGVSLIQNKKIRRITQVILIAWHVECGVHNFIHWH